jgi:isopentenyl diphosphate isomerase/L-lactate dehydrogenase-like FMN-dependent dehydrogenase
VEVSRRTFLYGLAAGSLTGVLTSCSRRASDPTDLITTADQALDIFELEAIARAKLPPAHFGYLASGSDDDRTVQSNRDAFDQWYLRPGRMVDVTQVDTGVELLGVRWPSPIVLAPVGSQKAFHPDGELASARAARAANHLQILSSVTSTSVEEVGAERGTPIWYQLYPTSRWEIGSALVRRAAAAGASAIVLTVDYPGQHNRETQYKAARLDARNCKQCHTDATGDMRRKPMYQGTDVTIEEFYAPNVTWDMIGKLREVTTLPILIKGILTGEDAAGCVSRGVDGVIVSNHGGRTIETLRGTLSCLPEVVSAVGGKIPVLIDGGFRRGTDILKALALGADAICVGRPYIWGLAAFGQAGVERALALLRAELERAMRYTGVTSLEAIRPSLLGEA